MAKAIEKPEVMDPRFVEGVSVCLADVELRWTHLVNRDLEYGGDWNCQCKLDREQAVAMKKIGFNVKEDEADGSFWIQVKRIHTTRSGEVNKPPQLVMEDGSVIEEEPGNGTVADVYLFCKYTPPIKNKIYMSNLINRVIVKTLIKREPKASVQF